MSPQKKKRRPGRVRRVRIKSSQENPPRGIRGFFHEYFRQIRRYFITGMMVWVPLIFTAWVSWWLISNVGFGIEAFIERMVGRLNTLGERLAWFQFLSLLDYTPGLGFLLAFLLFLTTGFFTRYLAGQRIVLLGEQVVHMIPLINRVYIAAQQIRDVFVSRDGTIFQEVVLLEYPRPGLIVVGFVTSEDEGIVQRSAKRTLTAVFVPTTPNPTSGFLLYVPPDELTPLDISIEEAMKLIVSGGAYLPGRQQEVARIAAEKDRRGKKAGKPR
jgi:uncharacterized membrane protein